MAETPSTTYRIGRKEREALNAWGRWLAATSGGPASGARAISWLLRQVPPPEDLGAYAAEVRRAVKEL